MSHGGKNHDLGLRLNRDIECGWLHHLVGPIFHFTSFLAPMVHAEEWGSNPIFG
jgi:hypothetical protein